MRVMTRKGRYVAGVALASALAVSGCQPRGKALDLTVTLVNLAAPATLEVELVQNGVPGGDRTHTESYDGAAFFADPGISNRLLIVAHRRAESVTATARGLDAAGGLVAEVSDVFALETGTLTVGTLELGGPGKDSGADMGSDAGFDAMTGTDVGTDVGTDAGTDALPGTDAGTDMGATDAGPPVCGNGVLESGEVCDGGDLGGVDCLTEGFTSGTLGCLPTCTGFDYSACVCTFGLWGMPQAVPGTMSGDGRPAISPDGLTLYFDADRSGGFGGGDIWKMTRPDVTSGFGTPVIVPNVNTSAWEFSATESPTGLTLYFTRMNPPVNQLDVMESSRSDLLFDFGHLGAPTATALSTMGANESSPSLSADGLEMYLASSYCFTGDDILIASRPDTTMDFAAYAPLPGTVNTGAVECEPWISSDGLELYFASTRAGTTGASDLWVATRPDTISMFDNVTNLNALASGPVNTAGESSPSLSSDRRTLYFDWESGGMGEIRYIERSCM